MYLTYRNSDEHTEADRPSFVELEVVPRLPHRRDPVGEGAEIPADLIGARIINIGAAPPEADIEGGGLILDYIPHGGSTTKRVVFGFNDAALWVEFSS
jgi:hypothetical protein